MTTNQLQQAILLKYLATKTQFEHSGTDIYSEIIGITIT